MKNHEKSWKNAYSVLECSSKIGEKLLKNVEKKCWKNLEKSWKIMKNLEKYLEKVLKIC